MPQGALANHRPFQRTRLPGMALITSQVSRASPPSRSTLLLKLHPATTRRYGARGQAAAQVRDKTIHARSTCVIHRFTSTPQLANENAWSLPGRRRRRRSPLLQHPCPPPSTSHIADDARNHTHNERDEPPPLTKKREKKTGRCFGSIVREGGGSETSFVDGRRKHPLKAWTGLD